MFLFSSFSRSMYVDLKDPISYSHAFSFHPSYLLSGLPFLSFLLSYCFILPPFFFSLFLGSLFFNLSYYYSYTTLTLTLILLLFSIPFSLLLSPLSLYELIFSLRPHTTYARLQHTEDSNICYNTRSMNNA